MQDSLLKMIRTLSTTDRKSLTGKCLKTADETGALANSALIFTSAGAHQHKFPNRDAVIEKAVNVLLCALSVLNDPEIQATDEEVDATMSRQAQKWAGLQKAELISGDRIPYEAHVTVSLKSSSDEEIEAYRQACAGLGVKPIVLNLEKDGKNVMKDVMTSSVHMGNNTSARTYVFKLAEDLRKAGFVVTRLKLETVPWHPAAPAIESTLMPKDCYFESHVGVILETETAQEMEVCLADLRKRCTESGAHLSANAFKNKSDTSKVFMATLRTETGTASAFEAQVTAFKRTLMTNGFTLDPKVIMEFAVFDTNKGHDNAWTAPGG